MRNQRGGTKFFSKKLSLKIIHDAHEERKKKHVQGKPSLQD